MKKVLDIIKAIDLIDAKAVDLSHLVKEERVRLLPERKQCISGKGAVSAPWLPIRLALWLILSSFIPFSLPALSGQPPGIA